MVTNTGITDTGGIIPCPKCLNIYNRVNGRTLVIYFGIINGFEVYENFENFSLTFVWMQSQNMTNKSC